MQQNAIINNNMMFNLIPYDINTILNQIYQYKCFLVNINRALLLGNNISNIQKICLINSYWFNHWKKLVCYEVFQNEIDLNYHNNNFNVLGNGFCNIFQNINTDANFEPLEQGVNNDELKSFDPNINQQCIDWDSEFDIISLELWNLLFPQNNINNNYKFEFNLEKINSDSLIVNFSDNACYVFFWNSFIQNLGKVILKFDNNMNKIIFLDSIKQGSFRTFFRQNLSDLESGKDKIINYNNTLAITCLNKSDIKLPSKNPAKTPLGLNNIGYTCYMNAALQSLFNIKKLTNYLIELKSTILNQQIPIFILKAYLRTILFLSRTAPGSKKIVAYSPNEFYNIIKTEQEFNGDAGDSFDVVRHFIQKGHEQLLMVKQENYSVFSKYIINNMNNVNNIEVQNLNQTLNNYISLNKSFINNIFYFIERTQTKCMNCGTYTPSCFNFQFNMSFPLKKIAQWKLENMRKNFMNFNNNMCNNNMYNNNMGNNNMLNMCNNNMNNNNINLLSQGMNNMNLNNNMNKMNSGKSEDILNSYDTNIVLSKNNIHNNMNNNNYASSKINNNMNNANNNLNNMNKINTNFNNGNFMNNMNNMSNNMNNFTNNNINNNNMMNMGNNMQIQMSNNMMNMMNNNFNQFPNIQEPEVITLQEAFDFYKKGTEFGGTTFCQNCKMNTKLIQIASFYSLPEIIIIQMDRGEGNIYHKKITYTEFIDLNNQVESKLDNNKYRLICIITHRGGHGINGHYVAYCFLEDKKMWFLFNDNNVTQSSFNDAIEDGETYLLFYQRI